MVICDFISKVIGTLLVDLNLDAIASLFIWSSYVRPCDLYFLVALKKLAGNIDLQTTQHPFIDQTDIYLITKKKFRRKLSHRKQMRIFSVVDIIFLVIVEQFDKRINKFFVLFINFFVCRWFILHSLDRGTKHCCQFPLVWYYSVVSQCKIAVVVILVWNVGSSFKGVLIPVPLTGEINLTENVNWHNRCIGSSPT